MLFGRKLVAAIFIVGIVLVLATSHTTTRRLASIGYLGTVAPGQVVTVTGNGFQDNSTVTLTFQSTPIFLEAITADSSGNFTTQVTIPLGVPDGSHNIVATGIDPNGQPYSQSTLLFVQTPTTAATGPGGPLAFTGMNTEMLVATAVVALLIGSAAVRGARRRASERARETVDS